MSSGTNNGGGPRWADMPRGQCPKCGLVKPVGVTQHERGFLCRSPDKCGKRQRQRERKTRLALAKSEAQRRKRLADRIACRENKKAAMERKLRR